jgi:hypothetical protein
MHPVLYAEHERLLQHFLARSLVPKAGVDAIRAPVRCDSGQQPTVHIRRSDKGTRGH